MRRCPVVLACVDHVSSLWAVAFVRPVVPFASTSLVSFCRLRSPGFSHSAQPMLSLSFAIPMTEGRSSRSSAVAFGTSRISLRGLVSPPCALSQSGVVKVRVFVYLYVRLSVV